MPREKTSQKTVSDVKFGEDAEGKENTVTLTVRDSTGNSGQDSMKVIVPKITVSEVDPTDKKLANTPAYTSLTDGTFATLTVAILPETVKTTVKSDVSLKIDKATPDTSDKGTISSVAYEATDEFLYLTKKEQKSNKDALTDPVLKDQTIELGLYFKDIKVDDEELKVYSFFIYLTDIKSDNNTAVGVINTKYDIGSTGNLSGGGAGSYCITPLNIISISLGNMANENLCASTIIHENTHLNQGTAVYLNAIEAQLFLGRRFVSRTTCWDHIC